jgi:hypothetical protein
MLSLDAIGSLKSGKVDFRAISAWDPCFYTPQIWLQTHDVGGWRTVQGCAATTWMTCAPSSRPRHGPSHAGVQPASYGLH